MEHLWCWKYIIEGETKYCIGIDIVEGDIALNRKELIEHIRDLVQLLEDEE